MANSNYKEINAKEELNDPKSIFYTYQKLIQLRKEYDILIEGSYEEICKDDEHIFAYKRLMDNQELVVYCNFTDKEVVCDEEDLLDSAEILISNYDVHQKAKLKAYEAIVYIQNK